MCRFASILVIAMTEVKNPFLEEKRRLMVAVDNANGIQLLKLKADLEQVETKCRQWTQDKLQQLGSSIQETETMMQQIKKLPTKSAQKKEAIRLSRLIQGYKTEEDGVLVIGLVQKIRELKQSLKSEKR